MPRRKKMKRAKKVATKADKKTSVIVLMDPSLVKAIDKEWKAKKLSSRANLIRTALASYLKGSTGKAIKDSLPRIGRPKTK